MIFRKILILLILLVTITSLSSCGNGSATSTSSNAISTGIFLDSQVIGMHYISTSPDGKETKSGVTNLKGEYSYFIGGITKFFIGNIIVGTAPSDPIIGIKDLSEDEVEQTNIARFLQTIDKDHNPDNGINIDISTQNNAHNVPAIEFNENFDQQFESNKSILLDNSTDIELIGANQANFHANKAARLQSIENSSLYKAIANQKNYSSNYYNGQKLTNSQKKRVYLWVWENLMARELDMEFELSSKEIDDIEGDHDFAKKYLDYADALISVSSLASSTYDLASKAGTRTFAYELTKLTALTIDGCNATVKIYEAGGDSNSVDNDALCSTIIGITNPFGKTNSILDSASPILSDFLPKALPEIMRNYKLGYLTKNGKRIFTSSYSRADYAALTVSLLKIANDSYGAYRGSSINSELSSRIIAKEWLSAWFRSGFDRVFMSKEIDNGNVNLTDMTSQVEALARKYATSGAICDFTSWITIDKVTCENTAYELNYDTNLVMSIISENLAKSNVLYKNISPLIGSVSDNEGAIGLLDIDWGEISVEKEFDLVSATPNRYKIIYPSDQIKLIFDSNIDYSSINQGIYFLNISTQQKIYLDSDRWGASFGGDFFDTNNKEIIIDPLRLKGGIYELHFNHYLKNESDDSLSQDGKIGFNLYRPNSFVVNPIAQTFGNSQSIAYFDFSVFNKYITTNMTVSIELTNTAKNAFLDVGSSVAGGPGATGFQMCHVDSNAEVVGGRYIERAINHNRIRVIVNNGTNKSYSDTVKITLCDEENSCEIFNYPVSLNPDPTYPSDFCNNLN